MLALDDIIMAVDRGELNTLRHTVTEKQSTVWRTYCYQPNVDYCLIKLHRFTIF